MRNPLFPLALLCLGAHLHADVVPAPLFTDNAVLQRDKPIPVWGTADAGEKVAVTFAGETVATTADASGRWRVTLPASPARSEPADLVIRGDNLVTLANIVVGEVWLASGQSNMEWVVYNTYDKALDIPASANLPLIRHIKVAKTVADTPATASSGQWEVAGPRTTGRFTAAGYYFAKDIHDLLNVPVGIINSSWGGTPVEAWIDPTTLASDPTFASVAKAWARALENYPAAKIKYDDAVAAWEKERDAAKAAGRHFGKSRPNSIWGPGHQATPSGLYNGMIHPLIPYALRGAIWYQGESNAVRANEYRALFSAMITGWRRSFGQGDFPFYWVQLANFHSGKADGVPWAFLREAQTQTLALPATGQAVTIDIGDVNDVHARNKKDVGRRLARLALARTYGQKIIDSGPVFADARREGPGFRVRFNEIHGGLRAPLNTLSGFELAGADRVFKPAKAKLDNNTVLVTSAAVPDPVAVRYAWRNAPVAGLFNLEGLPAVPFRTDTW